MIYKLTVTILIKLNFFIEKTFSINTIPGRAEEFSLVQSVQSGSGVHPASYSVGTASLPGGKADGA
jgi:hypothetical protein